MSKERELLKEVLKVLEWNGIMGSHDTYNSIKELLAQPEQSTLKLRESSATETFNDAVSEALAFKPVAWKDKTYGNLHHVDYGNSIPLYLAPPPRKPLSNEEIEDARYNNNNDYEYNCGFENGVKFAEKAHGIRERWSDE